jgi:hypothetical protein
LLDGQVPIYEHPVRLWKDAAKGPLPFSLNIDFVDLFIAHGKLAMDGGSEGKHLKNPFYWFAVYGNHPKS